MADPEWLRGQSVQLRARADQARRLSRLVGSLVLVCWVSPAAARFRQQVEQRAGSLVRLAGELEEAADRLDTHARAVELEGNGIIPWWIR